MKRMVVAVAPAGSSAGEYALHSNFSCWRPGFIGLDDDLPIQDQIDRNLREHKVAVNVTF
jgi:hypothetical protein